MENNEIKNDLNELKFRELSFKISDDYNFDLESMIDIFCKIIDKLDLTYNYEYAIFDKRYWKKGWRKYEQLLKHVGKLSDISKEELMNIKDECNGFFWEAKYKRKQVIHISFFLTDVTSNPNNKNLKNHYNIIFSWYGQMYDKELIMELAQIIKEGIKAKDEIVIGICPKYYLNGERVPEITFYQF